MHCDVQSSRSDAWGRHLKNSSETGPSVSVIVVNFNGEHLLIACLDSILNQNYGNIEAIVVDNASSDGSRDLIRSKYPSVRILEMPTNLGYARGANRGISACTGEVCVLVDTDAILAPNWVSSILRVLRLDRVGIAGGKVYISGKANPLYSAGGLLNLKNGLAMMRGNGRPDTGSFDREEEVDWVTWCSAAFEKELTLRIGFLDTGYETYREDVDFCVRARRAGFRVMYAPGAVSWHAVSGTSERWGRKQYLLYRNWIRFNLINLSSWYLLPGILYSIFHTVLVFLRCVKRSEKAQALETLRALAWNLPRLANSLLLRRTILREP